MLERVESLLANNKIRLTKERREIIQEILNQNSHFSPEKLFIDLKNKGSKVSRASVYRTINILLDAGVIEQVEKNEESSHYEFTLGKKHHDHLICLNCGKIIEFYSPSLEVLQREICSKHEFIPQKHTLEIYGKCKKCNSG